MAKVLYIAIQEDLSFLRKSYKTSLASQRPRLYMLILMKEAGEAGISKEKLKHLVGVSGHSIQTWRQCYQKKGLAGLLSDGRSNRLKRVKTFTEAEHLALGSKLGDPHNGLGGYKDLQAWILSEFGKRIAYANLTYYCRRYFGASVKVARKSHIKKDEAKVEAFKKTFVTKLSPL